MEDNFPQHTEELKEQVNALNNIIGFLARRDLKSLEQQELEKAFGFSKADLLILLGSSLLYSAEVAAAAFKKGLAKSLMIVGGIGHSTEYLVNNIAKHPLYKAIDTRDRAEADILKDMLVHYLGINNERIIIENKSTNCGSNAKEALKTAGQLPEPPKSVILIQDPTMQLRTYASFLKEWSGESSVTFINYSPLVPYLEIENQSIVFAQDNMEGLWDITRFLSLVMGEIPRLRDDENGYGPKGKGFIVHVDIPQDVLSSYERLLHGYDSLNKGALSRNNLAME